MRQKKELGTLLRRNQNGGGLIYLNLVQSSGSMLPRAKDLPKKR
jgi:hypothetical protein